MSVLKVSHNQTRDVCCIYGYFREAEPLLHVSIPEIITKCVLQYYNNADAYNQGTLTKNLIVIYGNTLTSYDDSKYEPFGNAYLSNIIPDNGGVYLWQFKITSEIYIIEPDDSIFIGIVNTKTYKHNDNILFYQQQHNEDLFGKEISLNPNDSWRMIYDSHKHMIMWIMKHKIELQKPIPNGSYCAVVGFNAGQVQIELENSHYINRNWYTKYI